jgi:hypothetical protein
LATGDQPASLLDQNFVALGAATAIACSATGSNTVLLTPLTNYFVPSSYTDSSPVFCWVQQTTNTGVTTIAVIGPGGTSLGALTAYKQNGAVPLGSGDLVGGLSYRGNYNHLLNAGAGGFVVTTQVAGISEAPSDNNIYGRQNAAWQIVPVSGGGAPPGSTLPLINGIASAGSLTPYSRSDHVHPTDTSRIPDAPLTGGPYGRQAGSWVSVPAAAVRSYLAGVTASTAGAAITFTVAAGVATDTTNVAMMTLASALSKTTAAWVVGTANGALDTGTIAINTWYHAYLIMRTDTGVVDVLVSLSATAPTLPTSYTLFRRIGAMKTNASGQWTLFHQLGDEFLLDAPVNDVNTATLGTTATLFTLASVPTGVQVRAMCRGYFFNAAAFTSCLVTSPDESVQVADTPAGNRSMANPLANAGQGAVPPFTVRTNSSAQIRAVASAASSTLGLTTYGWLDRRGQDN